MTVTELARYYYNLSAYSVSGSTSTSSSSSSSNTSSASSSASSSTSDTVSLSSDAVKLSSVNQALTTMSGYLEQARALASLASEEGLSDDFRKTLSDRVESLLKQADATNTDKLNGAIVPNTEDESSSFAEAVDVSTTAGAKSALAVLQDAISQTRSAKETLGIVASEDSSTYSASTSSLSSTLKASMLAWKGSQLNVLMSSLNGSDDTTAMDNLYALLS